MPSSSRASEDAPRNRLLAALPRDDLAHLHTLLTPVDFPLLTPLMRPDQPIAAVYFPETGWVSMVALLDGGDAAEVGLVGEEGMVGLPLLLGRNTGTVEALVQGSGRMLRLEAAAFQRVVKDMPALVEGLLRYALTFQEQVTQTAACNGHHMLEQRLARWLLMAHDRAGRDEFPMTQDLLAMMLCVRRPGVTVAARRFQQQGLIRYGKGRMAILDRPGLEAAACRCYAAIRARSGH